jgi:ribonuclease HI
MDIPDTREASKEDDREDSAEIKIYADGSGIEGMAGAAAVMYRHGRRITDLRYRLGSLANHTTYEAEAVGVTLALELLSKERRAGSATILLDNQAVIQSIGRIKARPAQHVLEQVNSMANTVARPTGQRGLKLRFAWISGHDEVEGNVAADAEAKRASRGESSQEGELPPYLRAGQLPRSIAATRQQFRTELRAEWRRRWAASPRYDRLARIDNGLPSGKYFKTVAEFTRAQTSLITQLRTGHVPLNGHLHRIKKVASPLCPACKRTDETVHHYLFECRAHEHARHGLRRKLGSKANSVKEVLGSKKGMIAALRYVAATSRLKDVFGDVAHHNPN